MDSTILYSSMIMLQALAVPRETSKYTVTLCWFHHVRATMTTPHTRLWMMWPGQRDDPDAAAACCENLIENLIKPLRGSQRKP